MAPLTKMSQSAMVVRGPGTGVTSATV